MGDADDSYDFSKLEPFVERLRDGYDLVAGNRFKGGILAGAMPWAQVAGQSLPLVVARRLYGTPAGDIYCGLRGFDRRKIPTRHRASGMEFAIEMIVKASNVGLRVARSRRRSRPTRRAGYLTSTPGGTAGSRSGSCSSTAPWLFLYPGLFLLAVGTAGMALLIPGERGRSAASAST